MKYIEDTMIFVNSSVLETMVWMSIRYALGRHTIAATMHAADLFKVINDLKDVKTAVYRLNFMYKGADYAL